MGAKKIDLSGMVFGRLTVLRADGLKQYAKSKKLTWLCRCSCGNLSSVLTGGLKKPKGTRSCGCLHKEQSAKNGRDSRHLLAKEDTALNGLISIYKRNALKRGHEWSLSKEMVKSLFLNDCHYCGQAPSNVHVTRAGEYRYNGIDRVDNFCGYEEKNVVSCCSICNHAKHTMGGDVFKNWILKASSHLNGIRAIAELDRAEDDLK